MIKKLKIAGSKDGKDVSKKVDIVKVADLSRIGSKKFRKVEFVKTVTAYVSYDR